MTKTRRVYAWDGVFGMLWLACGLAGTGIAPAVAQSASEIVFHNFRAGPVRGWVPQSGVIRDSAGNLYGTTSLGGTAGYGVLYRLDTAGHQTPLHSFTNGADGGAPNAVMGDSAGNLYGTTGSGGTANAGVVYKLDPNCHETVLYSFTGGADGGTPTAGVIRDPAGNLYGTTNLGGAAGFGVVYEVDTTGHETVLYSFTGGPDGGKPSAGVIRDPEGNLYGTTGSGGVSDFGVVYTLDATGHETVLHSFTGDTDGGSPIAGVIRDSEGNLYGTTYAGGLSGAGVVYKLDTGGDETILYSFAGGADGRNPNAGVIRDAAGNLYGTTWDGGLGFGVVYSVNPAGDEKVLYSFTGGADGGLLMAGVTGDLSGNLYGTASSGGVANEGVVYKVNAAGHETVLYGFPGPAKGNLPYGGVIGDAAGNLYGTTDTGGSAGAGVVYKLDAAGQETVLYTFTGGADGRNPWSGVVRDAAGNLYGTTLSGGASNAGVVYKVDPAGQQTVLYSFTGGADGGYPFAGVILDAAGNLYGTTQQGGAGGYGVVYKLDTSGHQTVLYTFMGGPDGYTPNGVIRDAAGNLYGTTHWGGTGFVGVVYKLDPSGQQTVLYNFTGGADGGWPMAGVIRDPAGNLYGTTPGGGGTANAGVVYKLDTSAQETVLYSFAGGADGAYPQTALILDSAGNLYGTTPQGGASQGWGVVYKVGATGGETVLYAFTGGVDGGSPTAGVIRGPAGNLYGTAAGGKYDGGVVYALTVAATPQ